jgi:hypothetical protein
MSDTTEIELPESHREILAANSIAVRIGNSKPLFTSEKTHYVK